MRTLSKDDEKPYEFLDNHFAQYEELSEEELAAYGLTSDTIKKWGKLLQDYQRVYAEVPEIEGDRRDRIRARRERIRKQREEQHEDEGMHQKIEQQKEVKAEEEGSEKLKEEKQTTKVEQDPRKNVQKDQTQATSTIDALDLSKETRQIFIDMGITDVYEMITWYLAIKAQGALSTLAGNVYQEVEDKLTIFMRTLSKDDEKPYDKEVPSHHDLLLEKAQEKFGDDISGVLTQLHHEDHHCKAFIAFKNNLTVEEVTKLFSQLGITTWEENIEDVLHQFPKMRKIFGQNFVEEIIRLHYVENLTLQEICRQKGISEQTITRWMRKLGIPAVPAGQRNSKMHRALGKDPKAMLIELHHTQGLSLGVIVERTGISLTTIISWMETLGITVNKKKKPSNYMQQVLGDNPAETLRRLHHEEKLNMAKMGERFGVNEATVRVWMKVHNVQTFNYTTGNLKVHKVLGENPAEALRELHHTQKLSVTKIASIKRVERHTVTAWMREFGIEIKRYGTPRKKAS